MVRLIDTLLREKTLPRGARLELAQCPVFVANNICDYLYENKYHHLDELPNIAPPFERLFVEWMTFDKRTRLGVFIMAYDAAKPPPTTIAPVYLEQAHWLLQGYGFISWIKGAQFWWQVPVRADGTPIWMDGTPFHVRAIRGSRMESGLETDPEGASWFSLVNIEVPLWTLAFCHVKNVQRIENVPPAKLSKRAEKEHGVPLSKYYTLAITPMIRDKKQPAGGHHASPSLHIKRGHFKTYTAEKPLFGRKDLVGVYWWDAHVVGDYQKGTVVKDYEPKPEL